ncbi:NAM-like protein [Panicum miliaceum]|uniref:NAM-like protein n=1 Tax=Panicum miliaceum TaxID=4540 RepID=A0A3L6R6U4_PANMI|nr:NAM-like protein [Panicum miliaceum]
MWIPSAATLPFPQSAQGRFDPVAHRSNGEVDQSGVGLMRRRVLPPSSSHGRLADELFEHEQEDVEEACTGATGTGYFTGLVLNGVEESQDVTPTSDPIIHQPPATAKSSLGRTKNFSTEEDCILVSAWLNVGMDPIQGVDQSQGTYWARIHEYFHANKEFESTRTTVSLLNRWSTIQHDVNIFCGCVSRIEASNQSGSGVDDKIGNACALFKAEDNKQRKFTLMHCWNILKDKPKWMERRKEIGCAKKTSNKKQKTMANPTPASVEPAAPDAGGSDAQPDERPDGKKKEKQKLRQGRTIEAVDYLMAKKKEADLEKELKKEEMCNKAFALQEERIKLEREKFESEREQEDDRIKLEREKFEFKRELEEDRIIALDLSTMTYEQQQYYENRKNKILARRLNI